MILPAEPRIKVGIAEHSQFTVHPAEKTSNPLADNALTRISGIKIGKGFHWEREIDMLLPGEIEVIEHDNGTRDLINHVKVEDYLKSVISSEMSHNSPLDFLKAHAIISRSWVIGKILHSHPSGNSGKMLNDNEILTWQDTADHTGFDVCADDHCQRYQGVVDVDSCVIEAVDSTRGLILTTPSGEILDARFSKCCGGMTERFATCWQDTEPECLHPVADPWCDLSRLSTAGRNEILNAIMKDYDRSTTDFHDWTAEVNYSLIEQRLQEIQGINIGKITEIEPVERGASGRIFRLRIHGTERDIIVGKELLIRRLLSTSHLLSSAFDIVEQHSDGVTLKGHGWGHGVGLCQTGAACMAFEGHSFTEILNHYYPNSIISRAYA